MPRLLMVFFVCLTFHAFSQTDELDSLQKNLTLFPTEDSVRVQLLYDYALKMRRFNPNDSEEHYLAVIAAADRQKVNSVKIKALNGLAGAHGMQGEYSQSIDAFRQALEFATSLGNLEAMGDANNGLGIVYKRLGDYPQSLIYYSEALKLFDAVGAEGGTAIATENVGVLYDLMHEPEKAMEYYQKTLAIYKKLGQPLSMVSTYGNIAVLYLDEKRYEEALEIFKNSWKYYDSLGRPAQAIAPRVNAGYTLIRMKRFKEAKEILVAALADARAMDMLQEQTDILNNLYELEMQTGRTKQALTYALAHGELAQALGGKKFLANSFEIQSRAYEANGDYKKSLEAFKNYKAWSDSVFNDDKERAFNAQEVKVEVLQKNKQLAEQNIRMEYLQDMVTQETRLKWMMAVVSILLLAVGIMFYQKFSERKKVSEVLAAKNNEISKQKSHIEEMNFQLENRMLRAQINPHFIFNSLSSIQHFITSNDKPSALKYLTKFSNLLRQVLESSITGNVVMREELNLLKMYLELEALRFDDTFTYTVMVDPVLDTDLIEIPTMILQPLVENAVLHGLMPKKSDRKLSVSFHQQDKCMRIEVEDNGIGRVAAKELQKNNVRKNPSRGLSVTQQRLDSLREKYGWESTLLYTDLGENGNNVGTRVTITLPILENTI